ncbi:putative isochorismate synthase MenF [Rhodococcoides trifolii]|uniref:isochorismate synthase n=1 Tax=Rhodococcoides trifolii TaxID=908250 RepID=A0A917FN75_9NOCA|nr:isochorismate synthase [Rhodococcus trifolii]GGF93995.1 putative isochorismate synthase MenF [Rhodococcus trifolii]
MRFVYSRPDRSIDATGVRQSFDHIDDAREALADGAMVVGAIGFDTDTLCALVEPESVTRSETSWTGEPSVLPGAVVASQNPPPANHVARVRRALAILNHPNSALRKVVLARSLTLVFDSPMDPVALAAKLIESNPMHNGFCVDLTAARGQYYGRHLVGASPELLIRRTGTEVVCRPFAGTAARLADPVADAAAGVALLSSAKNLSEHRFVVDAISDALAPLCSDISVPDEPTLTSTPAVWHLATPITATLTDPATTALDLALALHPTPAVAGTPTALALQTIQRLEDGRSRGFYAGMVGWCDASGDGEWMVAIRCIDLALDGLSGTATAGGGIVADSDADAELEETTAKFGTILSALRTRV